MTLQLRIMCWNIDEGNWGLGRVADQIRQQSPDLVLLQEVKAKWLLFGEDQTRVLSQVTGLSFHTFGKTATLYYQLHNKGVAVLSRFPLGPTLMHPVMRGLTATGYATLETSISIGGLVHHIFCTRFDGHNDNDNHLGHQQAINLLQNIDSREPVIFGGDFNATPDSGQMINFVAFSGLTDALSEHPDPEMCDPEHIIDHIFYRGLYGVSSMQRRCPWQGDTGDLHAWLLSELVQRNVPPSLRQLSVGVHPYPAPLEQAIQVTVSASDSITGAPVTGTVHIHNFSTGGVSGRPVEMQFSTNTPFMITLHTHTESHYDPATGNVEQEVVYPTGLVSAAGYQNTDIDLGMPSL